MARRVVAALACLVALSLGGLAASCELKVGTSKGTEEPHAGTPLATALPAEGIEGFSAFSAASGRYRIAYPVDWTAQESAMKLRSLTTDVFIAPNADDGFTANVSVLCEPLAPLKSTAEYREAALKDLRQRFKIEPTEGDDVVAAGESVKELQWETVASGISYEVTAVVVARGDCGWTLALGTAPGHRAEYLPIFRTMVASFSPTE